MKAQLALALLLFSVGAMATVAPANALIPSCTRTLTSTEGYTYTLTLSPCSTSGVALNSVITMTASTTDTSIVQVRFLIVNPLLTPSTLTATGSSPFTQTFTANVPGTWYVHAQFCNAVGTCLIATDVISLTVQILVLDALPLGAAAAAGISLLGVVAFRRLKKSPLPAK